MFGSVKLSVAKGGGGGGGGGVVGRYLEGVRALARAHIYIYIYHKVLFTSYYSLLFSYICIISTWV